METGQVDDRLLRSKFGRHTTSGLVAAIAVKGMALVVVKVLTIVLPKNQYGLYSLWMSFILLVSTISTSAFSATLWRFLPRRTDSETGADSSRLFATGIVGSTSLVAMAFILSVLLDVADIRVAEDPFYVSTLALAILVAILYALRELILVASGSEQNSREILVFNLVYGASSSLGACVLGLTTMDYRLALMGLGIGYAGPVLISLVVKLRHYGLSAPKRSDFSKAFTFGSPSIVMGFGGTLVPFLTSYLVGTLLGMQDVATLSIAFLLGTIFSFVVGPPLTAYHAYIVNAYERSSYEDGRRTTTLVVELFLTLATPVVWLMIMFAPLAIWIVSTELYVDATALVPFTVISAALVSCSYFWKIQLDLVEKPHLTGVVHIISSVLLAFLCILLIDPFGLVGVGIAIVCRAASVLVLLQIAGTRHARIEMKRSFWKGWTAATLALVASFVILHLLAVPSYIASLCSLLVYVLISKQTQIVDLNTLRGMVRLLTSRGPTIQAD